ncbi:hypothetical protein V5N11_015985 [Cardamine amara subsp. amara]|uniref:DUF7086 domain-containing protein n=1 Tax=Cardamine amara subsp. amara TaxID=228776 RepID=A0ABD1AR58_CARAN
MDDGNGANQRRNSRQIYEEDDRSTNRRRQTNEAVNDDEQLPLSLTLGSPSYSSQPQIPPVTSSLRQVPPPTPWPSEAVPMTTWPSQADIMRRMASNPFMTSSPYLPSSSSLSNNSLHQTGSQTIQPPLNFFPASSYGRPPSNRTIPEIPVVQRPTARSSRSQSTGNNNNTIPPPFPWATNIKGKIHTLEYLEAKQITTITGDVQCKYCEKVYRVSYNLRERFTEIERIFVLFKRIMRERALPMWTNPEIRRCELCGREKAVKPVIAERKHLINWLFLLLGQSLGYCTLEQLKNFCKHSKNHRTGAKDRVLYLTYLGLCKMLQPNRQLFCREKVNVRG